MVVLKMPTEQIHLVSDACSFYKRMMEGDFQALLDIDLDKSLPKEEYKEISREAEKILGEINQYLFRKPAEVNASHFRGKISEDKMVLELQNLFQQKELAQEQEVTITDQQAEFLSHICEFYARIRMGQYNEIVWDFLDMALPTDDYCNRRDVIENLLLEVRKLIYPDLHGIGHSYGIGKFEDADKVYDVHQVIRYAFGSWRTPFSYYVVPECHRIPD